MADRTYAATLSRRIAAPASLVWALIADSNRFERASGVQPARYETILLRPGDPTSRTRVAHAREYGIDVSWVEPPYEWIEGSRLHGSRKFYSGPMKHADFQVELRPDGEGTYLSAVASVTGSGVLALITGTILRIQLRQALERYVEAIERMLAGSMPALTNSSGKAPPASIVRQRLLLTPADTVVCGKITPVNDSDFAFRATRFEQAPVEAALRDRLLQFLRTRSDEEVAEIRPFELAGAWSMDRREVLRAFLHAARAGLVDLQWQLNCPTCRVAAARADSLSAVGNRSHCDTCNIAFDLDFAAHVEAVFRINPSVRRVQSQLFCASSPWFRPHVFAQLALCAGQSREVPMQLPSGPMLLRTLSGRARATFGSEDGPPRGVRIRLGNEEIAIETHGSVAPGEASAVTICNETSEEKVLLIERAGWNADVVLGSVIASLPDFIDLFATEAPASGVDLAVGSMAVLFSDLTGSTAMYERLGDARAFAVVQEHFQLLAGVVDRHGGAIIKTMGDAVMATFSSVVDALRAGFEMIAVTERKHGELGLKVKVGLYEGPCLAVRANDKLDFFGTTVNLAARLQAQAHGGQVVVADTVLQHEGVARLLDERKALVHKFEASLKGIREIQKLIALQQGGGDSRSPEAAEANWA